MLGYKAVAWNTSLGMTGWWQGRNVIGMTTNDANFNMAASDISQAVQIQQTWAAGENLPWLWEYDQGVNDKIGIACDIAMPVSYGTNLRQAVLGFRYEDISATQAGADHGQRLWIQFATFDSQNVNRPLYIYKDPYTANLDIVATVQIHKGQNTEFFDFSGSAEIQQNAYNDLQHFEVTQTRTQMYNLIKHIETQTGLDLQDQVGYWSMIQALVSPEMASFAVPQWGIGDHGAQQMALMNFEVWDG
jgi:hypothetical protein